MKSAQDPFATLNASDLGATASYTGGMLLYPYGATWTVYLLLKLAIWPKLMPAIIEAVPHWLSDVIADLNIIIPIAIATCALLSVRFRLRAKIADLVPAHGVLTEGWDDRRELTFRSARAAALLLLAGLALPLLHGPISSAGATALAYAADARRFLFLASSSSALLAVMFYRQRVRWDAV